MTFFRITLATYLIFSIAASSFAQKNKPIDPDATRETKMLFKSLKKLSKKYTLFGHQHATEYGHGWTGEEGRSDVKSVSGSHPAVIGVDLMGFTGRTPEQIADAKEKTRKTVIDTYDRGGVTTVAWHFSNPLSGGGFNWRDSVSVPAVRLMIPGGEAHEKYKEILRGIGEWANSLVGADGKMVPVIFRPYHEFDGGWFWWGKPHCTREEFIALWQFTVSYLRDELDVHNFLYCFSPDNRYLTEEVYLERYPGDAWVDMVGMDNYGDMGRNRYAVDTAALKLKIVSDYAKKAGKLAAFTETGLESIPNETWWTETLLPAMKMHKARLSYVLVWRNDIRSPTHYYAPYPGQVSVPNFLEFYNDDYTLFENDLKNVYKKKKL
ncbi:MAG: glycosyl hydrolase [Bacteroidetes bacterium]|nr:glycosyl hydrolase [Bacteroidota bacterium]